MKKSSDMARQPIIIFSKERAVSDPSIDYFVFGHVHVPQIIPVSEKASCVILGDWVIHFTYAQFDGNALEIKKFMGNSSDNSRNIQ